MTDHTDYLQEFLHAGKAIPHGRWLTTRTLIVPEDFEGSIGESSPSRTPPALECR